MNILVSSCLLGAACRYDGKSCPQEILKTAPKEYHFIPVCPEQLGGLPTPRPAAECKNGQVWNKKGENVTAQYQHGAEKALAIAKKYNCQYAILKEKSPSCGYGKIYDGSFSGIVINGNGVTAAYLREHGIKIIGESEIGLFLQTLQKQEIKQN